MKLDKKEMKMRYEYTLESVETGKLIDEAFNIIFEELFKLILQERTTQYA